MTFVFRLLLIFNATSLLVIIFLVQKGQNLGKFFSSPNFPVATPKCDMPSNG